MNKRVWENARLARLAKLERVYAALSRYFAACANEEDGDLITPWLYVEEAWADVDLSLIHI